MAFRVVCWPFVTTPISNKLFGRPKIPELGTTHCHPFTEDLTNLLMDEHNFSLNRIVSDVQTIDGNPWWCTGKSMSEALISASTNPQYENRLFIELPVHYMEIPSSKHG